MYLSPCSRWLVGKIVLFARQAINSEYRLRLAKTPKRFTVPVVLSHHWNINTTEKRYNFRYDGCMMDGLFYFVLYV